MPFLIYTSPQDKPQHFVSLCTFSCFCKLSEGPAMAMSAGTSAGGLCLFFCFSFRQKIFLLVLVFSSHVITQKRFYGWDLDVCVRDACEGEIADTGRIWGGVCASNSLRNWTRSSLQRTSADRFSQACTCHVDICPL